jgi:hypothetical protein
VSKPFTEGKPLSGAQSEMVSAMSALNMEPDPIPYVKSDNGPVFLSQSDGWAKHSLEHIHQAFEFISDAKKKIEAVKTLVFNLSREDKIDVDTFDKLFDALGELD